LSDENDDLRAQNVSLLGRIEVLLEELNALRAQNATTNIKRSCREIGESCREIGEMEENPQDETNATGNEDMPKSEAMLGDNLCQMNDGRSVTEMSIAAKKNSIKMMDDNQSALSDGKSVADIMSASLREINEQINKEMNEAIAEGKNELQLITLQHEQLLLKQDGLKEQLQSHAGDLLASKLIIGQL